MDKIVKSAIDNSLGVHTVHYMHTLTQQKNEAT